jgi:hypothetical protein
LYNDAMHLEYFSVGMWDILIGILIESKQRL